MEKWHRTPETGKPNPTEMRKNSPAPARVTITVPGAGKRRPLPFLFSRTRKSRNGLYALYCITTKPHSQNTVNSASVQQSTEDYLLDNWWPRSPFSVPTEYSPGDPQNRSGTSLPESATLLRRKTFPLSRGHSTWHRFQPTKRE